MSEKNYTTRAYEWGATPDDYITYTGTAGTSETLSEGEYCFSPSTACYIRLGATATAGEGSMLVGPYAQFHFIVTPAQALASVTLSVLKLADDGVATLNKVL